MSGPTSRVVNQHPSVISQCSIYKNIEDAQKRCGERLTFNLSGEEIIKILSDQPASPDLQKLIEKMLKIAENKVDKRGIDKQREIREKYQPTHGLIFKNIPVNVPRQVIYDAILKLGGSNVFEGELKMRSFQFPKDSKKMRSSRNAFPIFVLQSDRDKVLEIAEKNNGELNLPVENSREYSFSKKDWDGVVYVERVKNQQHSRSTSSIYSEHESDYQAINRSRTASFGNNDAFSNASFGSSNGLFRTPNPCATPNSLICTPNPIPPISNLNIMTSQVPMFSQPPSPYSINSLPSPMVPNFQQPAVVPNHQNFMQNNVPNQINPRLLQNMTVPTTTTNSYTGAQFVKDHGDNIIQKQQNAQIEKIRKTKSDVEADLD